MISNRIYTSLKFLSPIFYHLGIFSLTWDSNTLLFILPGKQKSIVVVNIILYQVWFLFLIVQLITFSLARDFNNFNFDFTVFIASLLGNASFYAANICRTESHTILNCMLIFLRRINCKFKKCNNLIYLLQIKFCLKIFN